MKNLLLFLFMTPLFLYGQSSLPSIDVKTLDGQTVNIKDAVANKDLTIISFWATWCKPCHNELDNVAKIYQDWVEDYDIELIAITVDDARGFAKVKPMISRKGWEYSFLSDKNQDLQRALNFKTIPQTFVVNKAGEILYSHSGYVPGNEFDLEDKIKEFLN